MAVVLALILLPLVIGLGSILSIVGAGAPIAEVITATCFIALAAGAFIGLMRLMAIRHVSRSVFTAWDPGRGSRRG